MDPHGTGERLARTPPRTAVRRLAIGRLVSLTGTIAAGTALSFSIYRQTGSAAWVAATMILTFGIIGLFGPIAGAIGDRFDRRLVMIVAETAAAVCWATMVLVADVPVVLLALAFLASAFEAPFPSAASAAIPNLAGPENLSWANSLIAMGRYAGLTLGPLIGGVLVAAVGARWVFAANAISFLVSVALVVSVHGDFADPDRGEEEVEEHRGLAAGFRFIARDRVLALLLVSWAAFLVGMASTIVADPVLAEACGSLLEDRYDPQGSRHRSIRTIRPVSWKPTHACPSNAEREAGVISGSASGPANISPLAPSITVIEAGCSGSGR